MEMQQKAPGKVITFYSFKGGVGRSMALANVAALMGKWGKKVLLVDFDLEAPGIEKYFTGEDFSFSRSRKECPGVVDLLTGLARNSPIHWNDCLITAKSNRHSVQCDILSAGKETGQYVPDLQSLNWDQLFEEFNLTEWLENMRGEWLQQYDFIFIDSRTGISDVGGLCTIYLPDIITFLFTTNEASLEGCINVVQRARASRNKLTYDRSMLMAIPVPSRSENDREFESSLKWKETFADRLGVFYKEWLPKEESAATAIDTLRIPYIAYWSFGDRLPVLEEGTLVNSIGHSFEKIALLILHNFEWGKVKTGLTTHDFNIALESKAQTIKEEAELEVSEKIRAERRDKYKKRVGWTAAILLLGLLTTILLYQPYQRWQFKRQIGQLPTLSAQFTDNESVFETRKLMIDASSFDVLKDKIGYFKNLETIVIQNCQAENLLFLKDQTQLRALAMYDNEFLTSLSGIESLKKLEQLTVVNSSALPNLDGIGGLSEISMLKVSGNKALKSLSGLERLKKLRLLEVTGNDSLAGIDPIRQIPELGTLAISCKLFTSLTDYPNLKTLDSLEVHNSLEDFNGFDHIPRLYSLVIAFNPNLTGLEMLHPLQNLHRLALMSNDNLSGLSGIEKLQNLKILELTGNQSLRSLDGIEKLQGLDSLTVDEYDQIRIESLYKLSQLKKLNIPKSFKIDERRLRKNNKNIQIKQSQYSKPY